MSQKQNLNIKERRTAFFRDIYQVLEFMIHYSPKTDLDTNFLNMEN